MEEYVHYISLSILFIYGLYISKKTFIDWQMMHNLQLFVLIGFAIGGCKPPVVATFVIFWNSMFNYKGGYRKWLRVIIKKIHKK